MSINTSGLEAYNARLQWLEGLQQQAIDKRLELEARAEYDPELQVAVRSICTESPFFWFDHFAWTYDPRDIGKEWKPFILFDYQRDLINWMLEAIEGTAGTAIRKNLVIEKSRDMGASWVVFIFMLWYWMFRNGSFLIGSRKQEEVDVRGDLDTPFEKMRQVLYRQPQYLMPPGFKSKEHDKLLCLINPAGGEITGEASTTNFGRGGRKLMIGFDEMAAMETAERAWASASQSTNVRLAISTPYGPNNKFARLVSGKDTEDCSVKRLHWSLHPIKSAGLTVDPEGKLTSYWYEQQVATMSAEDIAKELDISYASSIKGLVFPDYTEKHKVQDYKPDTSGCILRVFDPGLRFHVGFYHVDLYNRVIAFRELHFEDARIRDVGEAVSQICAELDEEYGALIYYDYGDPAGATRNGAGAEAPEYEILREYDIDVDYHTFNEMPAKMRVKNRVTGIHRLLGEFCTQRGTPRILVDTKHCPILDEALESGYRYKVDRLTREPTDQIDEQHPHEDAVDCLGYGIIGHLGLEVTRRNANRHTGWATPQTVWDGQLKRKGWR